MKQLKMECGTILSHVYNPLEEIHELHVEDCRMAGTVTVDDRIVARQAKIVICADTLPEVIEFLQEAQEETCK